MKQKQLPMFWEIDNYSIMLSLHQKQCQITTQYHKKEEEEQEKRQKKESSEYKYCGDC